MVYSPRHFTDPIFGSFLVLADQAQEQIQAIIEDAAASENPPGSDAQKTGDFYKSYMNVERIEELQGELTLIDWLTNKNDVARHFGYLTHLGVDSPIGFMVMQDAKKSTSYLSAIRANGPVTNIDAFYEAFDVHSGDQLFKPESERIRIW